MSQPTVIEALRRFLPHYLSSKPRLSREQRRAWVGIESNAEYLAIAQNRIASVVAEQGFL